MIYFFFRYQFTSHKIPTTKAGPAIIRAQDTLYHSKGLITSIIIYNSPPRIKAIAPTISHLHAINNAITKIKEGIKCMNSPTIVPKKPRFMSNISSANMLRNKIKIIEIILGAQ